MSDGELIISEDDVAGDIAAAGTVLSAGYVIGKMLDEDNSCNGGLIGAGAAAILLGGLVNYPRQSRGLEFISRSKRLLLLDHLSCYYKPFLLWLFTSYCSMFCFVFLS
jgi:hypothetical protein